MAELLILYGSQMGTTEGFAKVVATFAQIRNFKVRLSKLDEFDYTNGLTKEGVQAVFLTSTFYNGEFPDNAAKFWRWLSDKHRPADLLKGLRFAVFGLGNSSLSDSFNAAAKHLHRRLKELGATQLCEPGFGDEYHPNGHDTAFQPWLRSLWNALGSTVKEMSLPVTVNAKVEENRAGAATPTLPVPSGFTAVPVLHNHSLSPAGYDREIRLLTFDVGKVGLKYELLDHILVQPVNNPSLVSRAAKRLHLDLHATVQITPINSSIPLDIPSTLTVEQLLSHYIDISAVPSRALMEGMSFLATDPHEKEELDKTATDMTEGNKYATLSQRDVFTIVDVLEKYPSVNFTLNQFISNMPLISARYYSVCSAPSVHPTHMDIVFVMQNWTGLSKKVFDGLATGYLSRLKPGQTALIKIVRGVVKLPQPNVPIVGVALGTGIGPFRAILQHHQNLKKQGTTVAKMLLYYGVRHKAKDFSFESELRAWENEGLVQLVPAFSHDQKEFILCNHKILENPALPYSYLVTNVGCYIYCGLGGIIPGTVERDLQYAIQEQCDTLDAGGIVKALKSETRWQVEAYSRSLDAENELKDLNLRKGGKVSNSDISIAEKFADAKMFCFQCEQTCHGTGCTTKGVCGKTPEVAALQDLLVHELKILSWFAHQLIQLGKVPEYNLKTEDVEDMEVNRFSLEALFSTLTNVNFDEKRIVQYVNKAQFLAEKLKAKCKALCDKLGAKYKECPASNGLSTQGKSEKDIEDLMVKQGQGVGVLSRYKSAKNDALVGVQEMLVYGMKGIAAYADHALLFKKEEQEIYHFIHEAFTFLLSKESRNLDACVGMLMKCGQANLTTLKVLHEANNTLGVQSPAKVSVKPFPGKCILVSGHDLRMLLAILEQTQGTGINVYTHGELLPAHGYPKLREFKHLVGHFGIAWQRQSVEFPHFPGAIVMTTNCLTPPKDEYGGRLFTAGAVGFPDIPHVSDMNFARVIKVAQDCEGFPEGCTEFSYPAAPNSAADGSYTVGFGSETVISVAPTVLDAVKKGLISRFYVIGGCDGFEGERSYYTELAKRLPDTSVVLTVGCGKFRLNHLPWQTIGDTGIPRLLDLGQCNDSYSAVQIALALANALGCGVNDLPLSIVLSWFEQKAVAVLLTLLSLGIKNIRVGPQLPAFLHPSVVGVLSSKFGLKLVGDPVSDITDMIAAH